MIMRPIPLAFCAAVVSVNAALAHAFLDHASPAVGSTVHGSPAELRLWFTEALEPTFSTVQLQDATGKPVATIAAVVDPANRNQRTLPMPKLEPGTFKVIWSVLSVDTHKTTGSFTFTVAP